MNNKYNLASSNICKKLLLLLVVLFHFVNANAQTMRDVLTLKNGSIIKGIIIEQTPPTQLKIQTSDGSVFVYTYDQIEKITREETTPTPALKEAPNMTEYGGQVGLGICIGGGGLLGVPLRFYPNRKFALEAGLFVRPTYIETTTYTPWGPEKTQSEFTFPMFLSGGVNIFLGEKHNPNNNHILRNGIMLKAGSTLTSNYGETMFAFGWTRERFKTARKKASYIFELGAGVFMYDGLNTPMSALEWDSQVLPMLYWKFQWQWFVK